MPITPHPWRPQARPVPGRSALRPPIATPPVSPSHHAGRHWLRLWLVVACQFTTLWLATPSPIRAQGEATGPHPAAIDANGASAATDIGTAPSPTMGDRAPSSPGLPQEPRAGARQGGAQAPPMRNETPVSSSATGPSPGDLPTGPMEAGDPAPTGPEIATVGIYLLNVNDIDVKASIFMLDFYIWFRWRGQHDPTASFEFLNIVDRWGMTRDAVYAEPEVLPDGTKYQVFHVQGKFNRKFDLRAYPLDAQDLTIEVEDSQLDAGRLRYVADTTATGFDPAINIPGWLIERDELAATVYRHQTDFGRPLPSPDRGDTAAPPPRPHLSLLPPGVSTPAALGIGAIAGHLRSGRTAGESYARVVYRLAIYRPWLPYLTRLLVPVLVVLGSSFLVFLLAPGYVDSRIGIAITGLLTAVALHLTVSADLPQVGYLRLIDKIYNLSYALIFLSLLESVAAIRWRDQGREELAQRVDRICLVALPTASILGLVALIYLR